MPHLLAHIRTRISVGHLSFTTAFADKSQDRVQVVVAWTTEPRGKKKIQG